MTHTGSPVPLSPAGTQNPSGPVGARDDSGRTPDTVSPRVATAPPEDLVAPPAPRPPATAAPAADAASGAAEGRRRGGRLARAALVTAALSVAGSLLGLFRDQTIAHLFGAGPETDAFLVAWTLPEVASTLLIEDAMALVLVPAFSLAVADDTVRALVRSTLPRLCLTLSACSAVLIAAAPWVVDVLAPGLPAHATAVACTRLTATCVFSFGLVGYCSAALRAHGRFLAPGSIYVAYNAGIVAVMLAFGLRYGVRAAAAGVAVGATLMVLVQAPSLWRRVRAAARRGVAAGRAPVGLALVAPVIVFAFTRQSQVLVERFLAAPLPAGAISHLNYAQKVAQMPMSLSLMLCTVTFPVVSRAMAKGDTDTARRQVERDIGLAATIVLVGAAVVIACAPQIVQVLLQRGAFHAADTLATATVMRVYALGLLGQTLVGALVRCYFSAARPLWYPAFAMLAGLALTTLSGALLVHVWGVLGIAAANAIGISATAALLLASIARHSVPVRAGRVAGGLVRLSLAAAASTGAGWLCGALLPSPLLGALAGSAAVAAVFLVVARALGAPEIDTVLSPVTRKLAHAR